MMILRSTAELSQSRSIAQLGIMTCERPVLLRRALDSYIAHSKDDREIEYVVFDDSKNAAGRRASLAVARDVRRKYNVHVRFAGCTERAWYVRRLREYTDEDSAELMAGFLLSDGYTLGQNRNALLMDAAGVKCFCADDDTICTPVLPPLTESGGFKAVFGEDPSDYWCFVKPDEPLVPSQPVEIDVFAAHERLLGRTMGELSDRFLQRTSEQPFGQIGCLPLSDAQVRVTFNGLAGDCGWGSPFGLWHAPMGYLAFTGESLRRLIRSDEVYRQAVVSRRLLRVTTCEAISDFSFSMLTFCALDNREMLPPNPPAQRGQDLVFGQILLKCFIGAISGHVPLALRHEPAPPRNFWPGEISRSAAGVDLCRLFIEIVNDCEYQSVEIRPAQRLRKLGRHFLQVAALPDKRLASFFRERLCESNRRFARHLLARVESLRPSGRAYGADLSAYFQKLRLAESQENYWLPLDLWSIDGAANSIRKLRKQLTDFGALLKAWPTLFAAAQRLRRDGLRLSLAV